MHWSFMLQHTILMCWNQTISMQFAAFLLSEFSTISLGNCQFWFKQQKVIPLFSLNNQVKIRLLDHFYPNVPDILIDPPFLSKHIKPQEEAWNGSFPNSSQIEPSLLTPWTWSSRFRTGNQIRFCCLSQPGGSNLLWQMQQRNIQ